MITVRIESEKFDNEAKTQEPLSDRQLAELVGSVLESVSEHIDDPGKFFGHLILQTAPHPDETSRTDDRIVASILSHARRMI